MCGKRSFTAAFLLLSLAGCRSQGVQPGKENLQQLPFKELTEISYTGKLIIAEGLSYDILFSESDTVYTVNGLAAPAKGDHDFVGFIGKDDSHATLYVSHESGSVDPILGDGGGGSFVPMKKENGRWIVDGKITAADFSTVGGTINNCGGTVTPGKKIWTAEEMMPTDNGMLSNKGKAFSDLSDFNGMPRYMNMGWMVQVDPATGKADKKLFQFGRYVHEDAYCTPDGKTVFLTDDYAPCVFFKFVADTAFRYDSGQLYAYRMGDDGKAGSWITLPMDMESLKNIREVAMKMGASIFARHEWVDGFGDKVFITETGTDVIDWSEEVAMGAHVPQYFRDSLQTGENQFSDPYGRVLMLDLNTQQMSVYLEGGKIEKYTDGCFSNPDGLAIAQYNGKHYLVINEDVIALSQGRVPEEYAKKGELYTEIFWLDASLENPTREDLLRFAIGPKGAETTGSQFDADFSTYFFSVQHPSSGNPSPFHRSCTVAVKLF